MEPLMAAPDSPRLSATPGLRVTLLGELTLASPTGALPLPASRKTRALFAYLLLCARPVRRERLCDLFFDIPDDPRAALRWSLTKIRKMLDGAAGLLRADRERVELRVEGLRTDTAELSHALHHFEGLSAERLLAFAERAMEPPLAGLDLPGLDTYSAWLTAERAEIDTLRAAFLAHAAASPLLPPEQARRFAQEAAGLGVEAPVPSSPPSAPGASPAAALGLNQHVHYCFAPDGVRIAYACTGDGPPLVKTANWLNHLELDWTGLVWGRLFADLSEGQTLIRYDERGNGLSDWDADISFDAFVHDLETVVDHLGLDRFPLLGISQGCAVSIEYAARHPERVSRLILFGGYAAGWRHTADAVEQAQREAIITLARHGWGSNNPIYRQLFTQSFIPSGTPEEISFFNDFQKATASPENAVRFLEVFSRIDVRPRLPQVKAPTLVLHARGDQRVPLALGLELASAIRGASLVTLDTDSHIPLSREPAAARAVDCIRAFLRDMPAVTGAGRRLADAIPQWSAKGWRGEG
jgi:pimeloyl-ACP methyl ester carboxylesterase